MKRFLILTLITILTAAGLLFISIAALFLKHEFCLPLHAYVFQEVEPATRKFEVADYPAALQIINAQQPLSPTASIELHYVRALCLQATGQFSQSRMEFSYIKHGSSDDDLKVRAALGEILAKARVPKILDQQTHFYDLAPSVDGI
jgi:hypothetical protein